MPVKLWTYSAQKTEARRKQQEQKEEEAVSRGDDAGVCNIKCSHCRKKRSTSENKTRKSKRLRRALPDWQRRG